MLGKIFKIIKDDKGMAIIEATFVFPIMFIILFFLIYMGNAFYEKAQIDAIVMEEAFMGAGYCADPLLETIKNENKVPSVKELRTEPYRYIFGGMNDIEAKINQETVSRVANYKSLFKNMNPQLVTSESQISKFNNYVVYATFSVEIEYKIKFPIKFLGTNNATVLTINSRAEAPVNDTAEFIRNTDMVIDLFSGTGIGKKISDVFGKINSFLSSFAEK